MDERHRIALALIEDVNAGVLYGEVLELNGRVNWPKIATSWDLLSSGEQIVIGTAAVIAEGPWSMQEAATVQGVLSGLDRTNRDRVLDAMQQAASVVLA